MAIRDVGVLPGDYELVDGEILLKTSQKPPHRIALMLLHNWLISLFCGLFVQNKATIEVAAPDMEHNAPDPDLAVTRESTTAYASANPGPGDLLLVVEISDATLLFDRTVKAGLYARSGIAEYWVVDVRGRQIVVHRQPAGDRYTDLAAYGEAELLAPLCRPDAALRVGDVMAPKQRPRQSHCESGARHVAYTSQLLASPDRHMHLIFLRTQRRRSNGHSGGAL